MKRWRRRLIVLLVLGGLVGLLYAARGWALPPLGRFLDVGRPPGAADYVMVLPGDESVRPFVAAALVRAGLAPRVLVPKTEAAPAVLDGIVAPTDEVIRRVLVARGVPESRIVTLEGETGHTHADAELLARFLESSPNARVMVVTSHYHTRRARWVFTQVLGPRAEQVSFVSAPTDRFSAESWWQVQEGFTATTSEYLKLTYYALRYGSLGYWAAGGVVVAAMAVVAVAVRRRKRLHGPLPVAR